MKNKKMDNGLSYFLDHPQIKRNHSMGNAGGPSLKNLGGMFATTKDSSGKTVSKNYKKGGESKQRSQSSTYKPTRVSTDRRGVKTIDASFKPGRYN